MFKNKKKIFITIFLYGLFFACNPLFAWDNELTHPKITQKVLDKKSDDIQAYLQTNLGLTNGVDESFDGKTLFNIITNGSDTEDNFPRAKNHFYNPLDGSGLHDYCNSGESNLEWAQDNLNNEYSWPRAREYFYQAMTEADNKARSQKLALAFRSLGQVMHLIQDMAVPAHTRNDFRGHLTPQKWPGIKPVDWINPINYVGNNFEYYVKWQQKQNNQTILSYFSPDATPDFNALSLFWHTDTGEGLADYSNANFLSKYRMLDATGFPHPSKADTNWNSIDWKHPEKVIAEDGYEDGVVYIKSTTASGVKHLAGVRYTAKDAKDYMKHEPMPVLDDKCHNDYAAILLPKAGGYAEGVLSYFFRGTLALTEPTIIKGSSSSGITQIKAKVANTTPNDEATSGSLIAFARFKIDPTAKDFSYAVSGGTAQNISLLKDDDPAKYTFSFSENSIPANVTELYLHVVYYGTLGQEVGTGVAIGMASVYKEYVLIKYSQSNTTNAAEWAFIWDVLTNDYASIDNNGTRIGPPCDYSSIEQWIDDKTESIGKELYSKSGQSGDVPECETWNFSHWIPGTCSDTKPSGIWDHAGNPIGNNTFTKEVNSRRDECCPSDLECKRDYENDGSTYYMAYTYKYYTLQQIIEGSLYSDSANYICNNNTHAKTSYDVKINLSETLECSGINCMTQNGGYFTCNFTRTQHYMRITPFGVQLSEYEFTTASNASRLDILDASPSLHWNGPGWIEASYSKKPNVWNYDLYTGNTIVQVYSNQTLIKNARWENGCQPLPYCMQLGGVPPYGTPTITGTFSYSLIPFAVQAQCDFLENAETQDPRQLSRSSKLENAIKNLQSAVDNLVGFDSSDASYGSGLVVEIRKPHD